MIRFVTFGAVLMMAGLSVSPAAAKTYYCEINKTSRGGDASSLPPDVYVWHDEKAGTVKVLDGVIQEMFKEPIAGEVAVNNKKRITFSYTIKKVPGINQHGGKVLATGLSLRLTVQKKDGSATLSMKPLGFRNTFRGKGKCSIK